MVRAGILAAACAALLSACVPEGSADTDASTARIALGKRLFFDANLSGDGRTSCASCHKPELAFTDGLARSKGVEGREGTRNAPSLLGVAERPHLFWDGRETDLASAVLQPFTNSREMGLQNEAGLLSRVQADPNYAISMKNAYGDAAEVPTMKHVGDALAAYLKMALPRRTSAYSRYRSGDATALNDDELGGLELFHGKAGCASCHRLDDGDSMTDDQFHHLGTADKSISGRVADAISRLNAAADLNEALLGEPDIAGLGRFAITRRPHDLASFRTPSLRNVGLTAPYMHDGSVATLEDAVEQELYYRALNQSETRSLTVSERRRLIAFLFSLNDR